MSWIGNTGIGQGDHLVRQAVIPGANERSAIEAFCLELSRTLSAGQASPPNPEVDDSGVRGRLALFARHARRLPVSVHARLGVALNHDQIASKLWLIERLAGAATLDESHILIVGSWFGVLPLLFQCLYPRQRIRTSLVDIDPVACEVASALLDGIVANTTITCQDAIEVDYDAFRREPRGIVVNTICEHMSGFADWYERVGPGQLIALQSNDHWGCSEHTNCVASLDEFDAQAPLTEMLFRGTLQLANFRRFMLVGRR